MELFCTQCGCELVVTRVLKEDMVRPPVPLRYWLVCPWCQARSQMAIEWEDGFTRPRSVLLLIAPGQSMRPRPAPREINRHTVAGAFPNTKYCYGCGQPHRRFPMQSQDGRNLFCSNACYRQAERAKQQLRFVSQQRREHVPAKSLQHVSSLPPCPACGFTYAIRRLSDTQWHCGHCEANFHPAIPPLPVEDSMD